VIAHFDRDEFLEHRFDWKSGEHVVVLAPTGWGKTHLLHQLLERVATKDNPAVVLIVKPKDSTVEKFRKRLKWRRIEEYPEPAPLLQHLREKTAGVVVWPRHRFDPDVDEPRIHRTMRRAILHCYRHGKRIVVVDEAYSMGKEYGLDREMVTVLSKGRSMGTAIFGASQKPSHIPLWFYSQSEHLFLGNDPDKRARQRYAEIGGVDPKLVEAEVSGLRQREFLYIRRNGHNGPEMAVIRP
jgi:hypothetical protein